MILITKTNLHQLKIEPCKAKRIQTYNSAYVAACRLLLKRDLTWRTTPGKGKGPAAANGKANSQLINRVGHSAEHSSNGGM